MKKISPSDIELVVTVALRKELPMDWLRSCRVSVHTLAAATSGALHRPGERRRGILFLVTGAGPDASQGAARWIRSALSPLFVLNVGTCGIINRRLRTGTWFRPSSVASEQGTGLELDTRLPVPMPKGVKDIPSLLSVKKEGTISADSHDIIDMECHSQAAVFRESDITFHCLKFGTDYADQNTNRDFNSTLEDFQESFRKLFHFLGEDPPLLTPPVPGGGTEGFITGSDAYQAPVTAVIPVYNREATIGRAVDSLLSQSLPPAEVVVVNDCSTDRTRTILASYGSDITVIDLPRNSGPSKARNEGIRHARTEWIAFLDSDDCWNRDKLKRQVDYLHHYPCYQIIQSGEIWIRNGKRVNPCRHHGKPHGWIWEPSLERCLVSPSAVLIRKSLLEEHGGFDESLPACEDYDLWLRISRTHPPYRPRQYPPGLKWPLVFGRLLQFG